ncbi:MAG TPA: ammonium transporter [Thermoplasmata archaeon]|nr:ammonium transporter [Thermoplasmata archaeon]
MALDSGDIAWVIAATALVMIMTPALGFFYGGLVRRKNVVSTIAQCFAIFAVVSLVWAVWGYSLALGPSYNGFIGGFIGSFSNFGLNNVGAAPNPGYSATIPELLYFAFQLKFAAITPALIIGAFAERIRFKALLIFIVLWTTFVYVPIAHWNWGLGGFLKSLGVIDFAGGLVVHTAAGVSAVAAALVIGRRQGVDRLDSRPNNIPYVILGASVLWFGWFGFNAGSALHADALAVNALVVTNLAASGAAVSWMLTDWVRKGKPSAVGMAVGAVCGLVAITPASGYVGPMPSIIIGLVAGVLCNFVGSWRARTTLDDSLDVFACHGAGGIWGTIATGLFASSLINPLGPNGLFFGNPGQVGIQALACVIVAAFAFAGSYILLRIINIFTPVRVSPAEEDAGLDTSDFGEEAYVTGADEPTVEPDSTRASEA